MTDSCARTYHRPLWQSLILKCSLSACSCLIYVAKESMTADEMRLHDTSRHDTILGKSILKTEPCASFLPGRQLSLEGTVHNYTGLSSWRMTICQRPAKTSRQTLAHVSAERSPCIHDCGVNYFASLQLQLKTVKVS